MAFNPLNWLLGLFSLDIGIDLGTANTLVLVRGKGIVINEPSWVAIEKKTKRPLAIGAEAKEMVGRTPANVVALRPLKDGVISEFDITEAMLEYFIGKAHEQSIVPVPRPRVVVGIPSGATEVEKRAVYDATMAAGAREAYLIEEPMAAALGAGLPVGEVRGSMIVDIGGGTTELAVFSMGGIVVSRSLRVAGDEMDQDIVNYVRNKYNLLIGERMAERVKIAIGSAYPLKEEKTITVRGRNLVSGLPGGDRGLVGRDPRSPLRLGAHDHRHDQGRHRRDPARVDRRPDGDRHLPGRRRLAASGAARAAGQRTQDARLGRRRPDDLRRARRRVDPRGPGHQQTVPDRPRSGHGLIAPPRPAQAMKRPSSRSLVAGILVLVAWHCWCSRSPGS